MISTAEIFDAAILIVDDQEADVQLLEQILRNAGYTRVTSTRDPHSVCTLHHHNHYDLILLDLHMPGMDGFLVMGGLKEIETLGYLPVLVVTVDPAHKVRALQCGARDFLSKPFDQAEVLTRVHNLLEVRLLYESVRNYSMMLEGANRELEAFGYMVAHDLRKPLTVVNSYCQAIEELCGGMLDEACRGYLHEAYEGTLRMNGLIDVLLNFSRLAHVEPLRETVDLSAMAHEVAEELKLAEPERKMAFRISSGVVAEADPDLLRVVLANLLGNAWKYTSNHEEGVVEFSATEIDGTRAYFVSDNGIGFDPSKAETIFAPFHRLETGKEIGGLGIGLATVARIIQRHGGRVWAEGGPGKGATFYFTLGER